MNSTESAEIYSNINKRKIRNMLLIFVSCLFIGIFSVTTGIVIGQNRCLSLSKNMNADRFMYSQKTISGPTISQSAEIPSSISPTINSTIFPPASLVITSVNTPVKVLEDTSGWTVYENKDKGFSVKHPNDLKPEMLPDGDIAITKFGPTQKGETEFYDGINIAFRTEPMEGKTLLEAIEPNKKIAEELSGNKIVTKEITLNQVKGLEYKYEGYDYIYLPRKNGWFLEITDMSKDPGKIGYENIVQNILSSIKILD
jgi:hypothetical protein